ncbi:fibrobacter succinogenes major paralogous domain-containing protein [Fibrobacter sp. UWR1]|uniref:fibrobacter succinogenes major paralogous domain-containing protein n=1 Tax=Fibrobacter sp. UWR1 TaxID=2135645 RepID=UPI000DAD28AA|nr:fibrobacter succinogenes major paralogous domain-containing protein [Fibrobacter sp. UWR1]PZW67315.1 uncharacterized protein (TIGR02145 family) [Fibrobacter sp. UWR1]
MNNKMTKVFGTFGVAFSLAGLIACGDEVTQINQTGLDMVSSVEDLPKCTSDNEGEQIIVKDDGTIRYCSDGKWYATMGSAGSGAADTIFVSKNDTVFVGGDFACTTEKLKDDSGIKIICNGDSIGVVLNGADGKDGVDGAKGDAGETGKPGENGQDGAGCTVANENGALTITCGDKSVVMKLGEDGSLIGGEEIVLDSEQVAVSLDSVKGASQKGPFLSGSKVLVKELRDGRSLTQTGNNFDGKILNDKGEFRITARMLVSQYVMLEANGYYRNEVTGENSSSPLTLFGITDVTGRDIVNINLLTHLEYERVYYLVTKEGYTVKKAKKKAQQEIFDILHIDNSNFSNSEDLSIAGSSDEDGALLAFSILFQGDRSVSQLTELLTRVSTAMEKEGKWEDATAKAEIADWAMAADTSDRLADIRGKVDAWKLGSMVPKFEPYIRNFWVEELKLGICDAGKAGSISFVANANSKYYAKTYTDTTKTKVRFVCAENANGENEWRIATDFEKDTYNWKAGTDGKTMNGQVTGKVYIYDGLGKYTADHKAGWRTASKPESVYGGCTEISYEKIVKYTGADSSGYYQCQEKTRRWEQISSAVVDIANLTEGDDGFAQWGSVNTNVCYVYDTAPAYNGWRTGQSTDCTLGLNGCTKAVEAKGEMKYAKNGNYYMCKNNKWNLISDDVQKNTYKLTCNADNDGSVIPGTADTWYYVCDANQWRKATQAEYEACYLDGVCNACTQSTEGTFATFDKVVYGCASNAWVKTKISAENAKTKCDRENPGNVMFDVDTIAVNGVVANTIDWLCTEKGWHRASWEEYTLENWKAHLEKTLPKLDSFQDARDGRWYKKVTIGTQVWMAENLQYADSVATLNLKGNSWCYNHKPENCETMGRYYTWTAAMNINKSYQSTSVPAGMIQNPHRGICPEGWHIPTSSEWSTMNSKSGGYAAQQAIGNPGWPNATNASGFTALPAGSYDGGFSNVGSRAFFWSATEYNASCAHHWYMNASDAGLSYYSKNRGFSVRCLQDLN